MGGQIGGYAYIYKYEAIYESYFTLKNTYTQNSKIKTNQ